MFSDPQHVSHSLLLSYPEPSKSHLNCLYSIFHLEKPAFRRVSIHPSAEKTSHKFSMKNV